jgi:DNA-binding MarR family transcriptional regulator
MTNLFYQKHSDTSRAAAETNTTANMQRIKIYEYIFNKDAYGATGDELSEYFNIVPGTISARLRDLECDGVIVKTLNRRKTRFEKMATVYVSKDIAEKRNIQTESGKKESDLKSLQDENARMRLALLEILNFRRKNNVSINDIEAQRIAKKGLNI